MSELQTIELPVIPTDKLTSIEVSGAYYQQVVASYFHFVSMVGSEKFEELAKALAQNNMDLLDNEQDKKSAQTAHMFISLIKTLEESFKKDGAIVKETIELPSEDSDS